MMKYKIKLPYNLDKRGCRTPWRQKVRHPGFPAKKIKMLNSLTLFSSATELLENLIKKIFKSLN